MFLDTVSLIKKRKEKLLQAVSECKGVNACISSCRD